MKFDTLLSNHIGDFGRYQQYVFFLTCLPPIWSAVIIYMWTFTAIDVKFECDTTEDNVLLRGPLPPAVRDGCHRWEPNVVESNQTTLFGVEACPEANYRWLHGDRQRTSLTIDFALVCDREYFKAIAQSLFYVGMQIGSLAIGRYGRKPVLIIGSLAQVVVTCLAVVTTDLWSFILLRMLQGAITPALWNVPLLVALEYTGSTRRTVTGMVIELAFTTGMILLGGAAYNTSDWRSLQLMVGLPGLFFISYIWIFPESPRWLLTMGRRREAMVIIRRMARVNGRQVDDEVLDLLNDASTDVVQLAEKQTLHGESDDSGLHRMLHSETRETFGYVDLFRNPAIRRMSLICCFTWPTVTLIYYAISLNPGKIGGNFYGSFIMSAVVEIPAVLLLLLTLNTIGRRTLLSAGFMISGVALVALVAIPQDHPVAISVCINVAKWAVTSAFCIIYLHTSECFCTVLRSNALGLFAAVSRLGGIISPIANMYFGHSPVHRNATLLVFGVLATVAAILTMLLPETTNVPLPESIKDGEEFARDVKLGFLPRKRQSSAEEKCVSMEVAAINPTQVIA